MRRHILIRVIMFTLTLAVGQGLFAQAASVAKMPDKMTAAASVDIPPSLSQGICHDQADMCFGACFALSVCGLAIVPVDLAFFAVGAAKFYAPTRDARTDRASPPDPHPPKRLPRA